MAENKRSFLLYADLLHLVRKLPKDKIADLFLLILEYVNDEDPQPNDILLEIAFEPIKQQLKRDLNKWEGIKEKRSEAGKASAEARKAAKTAQKPDNNLTHVEFAQQTSTNPTVSVTDTVSVNVNDTVNVTDNVNTDKGVKKKSVSKTKPPPPNLKDVAKTSFENTNCQFGTEFKKNWLQLIGTKKWIKKQQSAVDMSLKKLMEFEESFAIALVENAIAGEYQGVVFPDTEAQYEKYNKLKNGQATSRETAIESRTRMYNLARNVLTGNTS
jgi:hypothetical protein